MGYTILREIGVVHTPGLDDLMAPPPAPKDPHMRDNGGGERTSVRVQEEAQLLDRARRSRSKKPGQDAKGKGKAVDPPSTSSANRSRETTPIRSKGKGKAVDRKDPPSTPSSDHSHETTPSRPSMPIPSVVVISSQTPSPARSHEQAVRDASPSGVETEPSVTPEPSNSGTDTDTNRKLSELNATPAETVAKYFTLAQNKGPAARKELWSKMLPGVPSLHASTYTRKRQCWESVDQDRRAEALGYMQDSVWHSPTTTMTWSEAMTGVHRRTHEVELAKKQIQRNQKQPATRKQSSQDRKHRNDDRRSDRDRRDDDRRSDRDRREDDRRSDRDGGRSDYRRRDDDYRRRDDDYRRRDDGYGSDRDGRRRNDDYRRRDDDYRRRDDGYSSNRDGRRRDDDYRRRDDDRSSDRDGRRNNSDNRKSNSSTSKRNKKPTSGSVSDFSDFSDRGKRTWVDPGSTPSQSSASNTSKPSPPPK